MLENLVNRLSVNQVRILVAILSIFSPSFAFSSPEFGVDGRLLTKNSYTIVGTLWLYIVDNTPTYDRGLYPFLLDFFSSTVILLFGIPSLVYGYYIIITIQGKSSRGKANAVGLLSIAPALIFGIIAIPWYLFGWGYFLYSGPVPLFCDL